MGQLSKKENKIFFFLIFMSPILGFRTYNKSTQNHIVSCSAAATLKFVSFLVKDRWVIQKYENKMKWFLQRILQEIMKKIPLGTSDAWLMRRSSHRPTDPAYYIEDWRILGGTAMTDPGNIFSWTLFANIFLPHLCCFFSFMYAYFLPHDHVVDQTINIFASS